MFLTRFFVDPDIQCTVLPERGEIQKLILFPFFLRASLKPYIVLDDESESEVENL